MEEYVPFSSDPPAFKKVKNVGKFAKFNKKGKKTIKGKITKKNNSFESKPEKRFHKMKLLFKEPCPEASEVRKLHPLIQYVFIPKRPPSIRYCLLQFQSAEDLEEVWNSLHKKRVKPYKGFLRCLKTDSDTLKEIKNSSPELLSEEYLTKVDIKHAKFVYDKSSGATLDVKCNSTARELFVRYGIGNHFISKGQEQNKIYTPVLSHEKDDGMESPVDT